MNTQVPVFIEKWFPIDVIGAESLRDASAAKKPPNNRLHVWWARRPLTTSRAALLASVLPSWNDSWPNTLLEQFPTEQIYHEWFKRLCGIYGDPVAGRKLIAWAKERNAKLKEGPYQHKRAFTVNPSPELLHTLGDLLEQAWGKRRLTVLDPFSGGGSIPFEALRYGFETKANELNPVASVILKATIEYPFKFGESLVTDIRKYGKLITDEVYNRLAPFYPIASDETIHAYLWARTVSCPYTGKPIPLSPNWWLQKGPKYAAVKPVFDDHEPSAWFEIVEGRDACAKIQPDQGTIKRGIAVSPWAQNQPVDGDYIKSEAQQGRMGQQLYAIAIKKSRGINFRAPTEDDVKSLPGVTSYYLLNHAKWVAANFIPIDKIPQGNKTSEPLRYGMSNWSDMFSPRQLVSLCTYVEILQEIKTRIRNELPSDRAEAVITYLAIPLDKAVDYNSRMVRWHSGRNVVAGTFDRHDFSFKWSHAEFDAARNLFPWALNQVVDAYKGLTQLAKKPDLFDAPDTTLPVAITRGSAADLKTIATASIDHICTDPPYEANVMYAECSDFFYIWMKRTLGDVFPDLFLDVLTNKDDEAVANVARFAEMGSKKNQLALADYERKMAAAFREMHRVLRDDGVLTVMFTHKKVEAWDKLASALIGAGFSIQSSWPVHTESEHSLHQAKKNAAQSTILLSCRKRKNRSEPSWWEDMQGEIRRTAREKAVEFEQKGIRGVDLYIATFGPTLAILSENWPVLTSETDERTGAPKQLRPEIALDLARQEVVALRKQKLLLGAQVKFDPPTDWYLMAWDAFQAEEFPADEARKLAIALGLDLDREVIAQKCLVRKNGQDVQFLLPKARAKRGNVDPTKTEFDCLVDAVHTLMVVYDKDGAEGCRSFLHQSGLAKNFPFKACLQAMLNAIPRTKIGKDFIRPEAKVLENLRLAIFDDLKVTDDGVPVVREKQKTLDEYLESKRQSDPGGQGELL